MMNLKLKLDDNLLYQLFKQSEDNPTVIPKILKSFDNHPHLLEFFHDRCNQDIEKYLSDSTVGLLYPKILLSGGYQQLDKWNIVQYCLILDKPAPLKVLYDNFKTYFRQFIVDKILLKSIELEAFKVFKFLSFDVGFELNEHHVELAYSSPSNAQEDIFSRNSFIDYKQLLFNELHIPPTAESFLRMIQRHQPITPYMTRNLLTPELYKTARIYWDEYPALMQTIDDFIFLHDIRLQNAHLPFNAWDIENAEIFNILSVETLVFLYDAFGTIGDEYEKLEMYFQHFLYYDNIQGIEFLLETLMWEPKDIGIYMDDIFSAKRSLTGYIIDYLDITDWYDIYKEEHGHFPHV